MKKMKFKSISLSFLAALFLWTAPTFSMEEGENFQQREGFRPVCWQLPLNDASLNFRLVCSWAKQFMDETYDAINTAQGVTPQWGNLNINGTLRYFLNRFVVEEIWYTHKFQRELWTQQDKEPYALLIKHNSKIKDFLPFPQQKDAGICKIFHFDQISFFYSDPFITPMNLKVIFSLPGNEQIQKISQTIQRIHQLRAQNPQAIAADFSVWNELVSIDPHMTIEDLQSAKVSCQNKTFEIFQNYPPRKSNLTRRP